MSYVGIKVCAIYLFNGLILCQNMCNDKDNCSMGPHSYGCFQCYIFSGVPNHGLQEALFFPPYSLSLPTPSPLSTLPLCCPLPQWHRQILSLGWARATFHHSSIIFSHFSSVFLYFLPPFGPTAHPLGKALSTPLPHPPSLYRCTISVMAVANTIFVLPLQVKMQYLQC